MLSAVPKENTTVGLLSSCRRDRTMTVMNSGFVGFGMMRSSSALSDIGSITVPLATGQMAFANGAVIPVDGGLSIPRL